MEVIASKPLPPLARDDLIYSEWPLVDSLRLMKLEGLSDQEAMTMLADLRRPRILSTADKWAESVKARDDLREFIAFMDDARPSLEQRSRDWTFLGKPLDAISQEQVQHLAPDDSANTTP